MTETEAFQRLQKIAERTKPGYRVEDVLTRLEKSLDELEQIAADRARLEKKQEEEYEAERHAQKEFSVGLPVAFKYLQKNEKGRIERFEESKFYGPQVIITPISRKVGTGALKLTVLKDKIQKL